MLRVLGATGRMFEVAAVLPAVEQKISFNGSTEHKIEVARSFDVNPNGLLFLNDKDMIRDYRIFETEVIEYIGNISTDEVREILKTLLVDGFYDFSEWEYQQEDKIENIRLDNGLSNPYSSAITGVLGFGMINNPEGKNLLDSVSYMKNRTIGDVTSNARCNIYDEDWNTEDFLDADSFDESGDDGWKDWDLEEQEIHKTTRKFHNYIQP